METAKSFAWLVMKFDELGLEPFPDWQFMYDIIEEEIKWLEKRKK